MPLALRDDGERFGKNRIGVNLRSRIVGGDECRFGREHLRRRRVAIVDRLGVGLVDLPLERTIHRLVDDVPDLLFGFLPGLRVGHIDPDHAHRLEGRFEDPDIALRAELFTRRLRGDDADESALQIGSARRRAFQASGAGCDSSQQEHSK
jgi:hypothetical protein